MTCHQIELNTDAAGAQTAYTPTIVNGVVVAIRYVPDGGSPLDTTWDATITAEASGLPILTITNGGTVAAQWFPRAATCDQSGVASAYVDLIPVAGERIKVVIAQGGAAKRGKLYLYVESES